MAAKKTQPHYNLILSLSIGIKYMIARLFLARAQDKAEEQRQMAAKEARRKQVQADERCATLEAQLAARKEQVAQLRSDLQVHHLSTRTSSPEKCKLIVVQPSTP